MSAAITPSAGLSRRPTVAEPLDSAAITVTGGLTAARVTHSPTAWRLARRNGELILQAGSLWVLGRESGIEWNDVPTVNLDEQETNQ